MNIGKRRLLVECDEIKELKKTKTCNAATGPNITFSGVTFYGNPVIGAEAVKQTYINQPNQKEKPEILQSKVTRFKRPTTDFLETKLFREITNKLTNIVGSIIVVIHGLPGSGKSEIAGSLIANFPYNKQQLFVKFHIQCSDERHIIKDELCKLIDQIKSNHLLPSGYDTAIVKSDINENYTESFVELLNCLQIPILILIEDPPKNERAFLTYFAKSCLSSKSWIHIYITSRNRNIGMPGYGKSKPVLNCVYYQVDGFGLDEAIEFLNPDDDIETDAVEKIATLLSWSPLGLVAVRSHCHQVDMSYAQYLEYFTNSDTQLFAHHSEIEHLKTVYGQNAVHLFTSIVTLLQPGLEATALTNNTWTVMKMMSYCHHSGIPQLLIERILQRDRKEEAKSVIALSHKNLVQAGEVITHLTDSGICKLEKLKRNKSDCVISFHQVVGTAVQLKIKSDSTLYSDHLKKIVTTLSSIVHKDLRETADNQFMNKIAPQIEAVIGHAEAELSLRDTTKLDKEMFLFWMYMCHLYEVIGITRSLGTLSYKASSEASLTKAMKVIFKMMSVITGQTIDIKSAISLNNGISLQERANSIVQFSLQAGKQVIRLFGPGVLDQYIANVLQMKDNELNYLKRRDNSKANTIETIGERYSRSVGLSAEMIKNLRDGSILFLDENLHCLMLFCERLTSILHTFGRVILYYNVDITSDFRKRFCFYSQLSRGIAKEYFEQTNNRILFEHLAAISFVPIMIKGLSKTNTKEKNTTHMECREILISMIENINEQRTNSEYYEHGHIKEIQGSEYTQMILRRYLIRINARLFKSFKNDPNFVQSSNETYRDLKNLSIKTKNLIMAPKCLVYCGKYQAAIGQYDKSADDISIALKVGICQSSNLYAWACYNYARAVVTGNLKSHRNDALVRCQKALKQKEQPDDDLIQKLSHLLHVLNNY